MGAAKKKAKVKAPAKKAVPRGQRAAHIGGDRLTEELKRLVVTELACFKSPSEVMELLKTEHSIEIARQSVQHYDPTTVAGRVLSKELATLFHDTRKAYREDTANVAISGRAERIRRLEKLATKAEGMGNLTLARDTYKQIAEEVGDVYTNTRKLDGKLGVEATAVAKLDLSGLTKEQLLALDGISSALAGKPASSR